MSMSTFGDGMEKNLRVTLGILDGFYREVPWIDDGSALCKNGTGEGFFDDELSALVYIQAVLRRWERGPPTSAVARGAEPDVAAQARVVGVHAVGSVERSKLVQEGEHGGGFMKMRTGLLRGRAGEMIAQCRGAGAGRRGCMGCARGLGRGSCGSRRRRWR